MSNALNALGNNFGKVVRHKLLFDEAEALLSARFAAFLLEPKDLAHLEADVAASMEMIAAARRATGQGRNEVAKLLEQANKIKAELKSAGPGAYEGDLFRATVSVSERETLDMDAVREKLSPQFIRAHTRVAEVQTVRVAARKAA